jgi:hypothetical protein
MCWEYRGFCIASKIKYLGLSLHGHGLRKDNRGMTHQRIVEIWKQLEAIDNSKVPLYNELFDVLYKGKYQDVYVGILQRHLEDQEKLVLIDMQETFEGKNE